MGTREGRMPGLAVGRFSPPVVSVPLAEPGFAAKRQSDAAELARTLPAPRLEPALANLLTRPDTANETKLACARALLVFHPNEQLSPLTELLGDSGAASFRDWISRALVGAQSADLLKEAMRILPGRLQLKLAQGLAEPGRS